MIRFRGLNLKNVPWYNSADNALNRVLPSLYHDYVGQRYYNSADGETAFPFTATRTTNAMQFDAQGRLIWAPVQLCTRGNDMTNWASLGTDGTIALSGNTAPTGAAAYLLTYTAASPAAGHTITGQPVVVGAAHTYSIYLRYVNHQWARVILYSASNSANQLRCWVDLQNKVIGSSSGAGSTLFNATVTDAGNGWVRVSISGSVPFSSTTDGAILATTAQADGSGTRVGGGAAIEMSSALLEPYDATPPHAWRSEYATTGSAWYGPRFDYDPANGQALGLLIEDSRTNDVPSSLNLTTSLITTQACASANSGTTYLGGWSAVTVTGDGTSSVHIAYAGSITPGASQARSISAIIKPISGTFFQLTGPGNWMVDTNGYANFNLTGNGSVTATGASGSNAFVRHLGGGVYHIGVTVTSSAAPTGATGCIVGLIASGTDSRLPSNTSTSSFEFIYACNSAATGWNSVIPTFGTAATKTADILASSSVGWFDKTKGTWYASVALGPTNDQVRRVVRMDDNSNNNSLAMVRSQSAQAQVVTQVAGVSDFSPSTGNTATAFAVSKMATVFNSPTKKVVLNGGTVATSSVAFPTSGYTNIRVGHTFSPNNYMQGWMRELRYYNSADATDAQLQTLTT